VKIVPPDAKLPDHFEVLEPRPEEAEEEIELTPEVIGEEIDAELEEMEDIPRPEEEY
jgi:small subunit ribosomal protein S3